MNLNQVSVAKGKDPLGALRTKPQTSDSSNAANAANRGPNQARVINFNTVKPAQQQGGLGVPNTGSNESSQQESPTKNQQQNSSNSLSNEPSRSQTTAFYTNNNNNNQLNKLRVDDISAGNRGPIAQMPQTRIGPNNNMNSSGGGATATTGSNSNNNNSNNGTTAASAAARQPKDPKELESDKDRFFQELRRVGVDRDFIQKGEELKAMTETSLRFGQYSVDGMLILTNYQVIFNAADNDRLYRFIDRREYQAIPLGMIHKIERTIEKKGIQYSYIEINVKDGRTYRFKYNPEFQNQSYDMSVKMHLLAFPEDVRKTFAYQAGIYERDLEERFGGWRVYDLKMEFERQGLFVGSPSEPSEFEYEANCAFKYLDNRGGIVCSTYPEWLVMPKKMSHDELIKCSKFRSKERMPALTFAFKRRPNSPSFTTLWRCAQCKPGINSNRSAEDELMLKVIGSLERGNNIPPKMVKIYDARPYLNAVGQQITGNGYENKQFYRNCEIEFLDIHNIHKVRESYKKMCAAAYASSTDYLKEVEKSEWLLHLSSILTGTRQVLDSLLNDVHVVVHCSDGWDRTAQLSCLSQMCIDPFFRTIIGFETLIEKDWVSFGHMFSQRSGHASKNSNDDQRAPVFIQFLDAVYQLTEQFPLSFEFTPKFLADIATHLYSCRFGTFLFNSHQDKLANKGIEGTISLWSYLESQRQTYLNPFYSPIEETNMSMIFPDGHSRRLSVWKEHFMYYLPGFIDPYHIYSECIFTEDNKSVLKRLSQMRYDQFREENKNLQRKILELETTLKEVQSKKEQLISFSEKSISLDDTSQSLSFFKDISQNNRDTDPAAAANSSCPTNSIAAVGNSSNFMFNPELARDASLSENQLQTNLEEVAVQSEAGENIESNIREGEADSVNATVGEELSCLDSAQLNTPSQQQLPEDATTFTENDNDNDTNLIDQEVEVEAEVEGEEESKQIDENNNEQIALDEDLSHESKDQATEGNQEVNNEFSNEESTRLI